jgi:hypothetical protein
MNLSEGKPFRAVLYISSSSSYKPATGKVWLKEWMTSIKTNQINMNNADIVQKILESFLATKLGKKKDK